NVVAFFGISTNLVAGDTNGVSDVFVHDRTTGVTERVSVDSVGVEGNDISYSYFGGLSADGTRISFETYATNFDPADTNGKRDIYLHDRTTGLTTWVSVDSSGGGSDGNSWESSISADGNCVVYTSDATNLVPGDTNASWDIFLC